MTGRVRNVGEQESDRSRWEPAAHARTVTRRRLAAHLSKSSIWALTGVVVRVLGSPLLPAGMSPPQRTFGPCPLPGRRRCEKSSCPACGTSSCFHGLSPQFRPAVCGSLRLGQPRGGTHPPGMRRRSGHLANPVFLLSGEERCRCGGPCGPKAVSQLDEPCASDESLRT